VRIEVRTRLWSFGWCGPAALAALLAGVPAGDARAGGDQDYEDFFGSYSHRIEGVTVGLGDAGASNAASQIINPWPAYSRNRDIHTESTRMIGAIKRYQSNSGGKSITVPDTPQSNAAPDDTGKDDKKPTVAPDTATPPSSDTSGGE
jgi:hypothetical protein